MEEIGSTICSYICRSTTAQERKIIANPKYDSGRTREWSLNLREIGHIYDWKRMLKVLPHKLCTTFQIELSVGRETTMNSDEHRRTLMN